jgi:arylsulfatase A-like enzyme
MLNQKGPFPTRRLRLFCLAAIVCLACGANGLAQNATTGARPNILWLTAEDIGTELDCYDDSYAKTPCIDRLADRGMRYLTAWSNAPVCAPARSTLISGMYPPSLGSHHMRSLIRMPDEMQMYPCYLREAGYYCSNNSKQDYNLELTGEVWDESSRNAHWKNRQPGQPFFAIFNVTSSHESKVSKPQVELVHDPDLAPLPAYHPDTPEIRRDWAQFYSNATAMDQQIGQRLDEIEEAGLTEDTIVFFYGDHGAGLPRHKRFAFDSGLRVGLLVYVPEIFRELAPADYSAGATSQRLAGFVDLGPTALSLAGVKPPGHMQGHALMGKYEASAQPYLYGFRGRTDERYDNVRTVRDERYVYIRHYMPYRPYGQHVEVMFNSRTAQVWKKLFDDGKLPPHQAAFWKTKPSEELYDLQEDPHEVRNLADAPEHEAVLQRMREALRQWQLEIRDVGLLPEGEMHQRSAGGAPYSMGNDKTLFDVETILATADLATNGRSDGVGKLKKCLASPDIAVRYWGAVGLLCRGKPAVDAANAELRKAIEDNSPCVRLVAAESLARYGDASDRESSLDALCNIAREETNGYAVLEAVNALEYVCVDLLQQGLDPASLIGRIKSIDPDRDYVPESPLNKKLVAWPQRVLAHIEQILAPESMP